MPLPSPTRCHMNAKRADQWERLVLYLELSSHTYVIHQRRRGRGTQGSSHSPLTLCSPTSPSSSSQQCPLASDLHEQPVLHPPPRLCSHFFRLCCVAHPLSKYAQCMNDRSYLFPSRLSSRELFSPPSPHPQIRPPFPSFSSTHHQLILFLLFFPLFLSPFSNFLTFFLHSRCLPSSPLKGHGEIRVRREFTVSSPQPMTDHFLFRPERQMSVCERVCLCVCACVR